MGSKNNLESDVILGNFLIDFISEGVTFPICLDKSSILLVD